nr:proline-rich receptor-like protein kinase PERK8 [Aegilops tauschii subsp. strangulata]
MAVGHPSSSSSAPRRPPLNQQMSVVALSLVPPPSRGLLCLSPIPSPLCTGAPRAMEATAGSTSSSTKSHAPQTVVALRRLRSTTGPATPPRVPASPATPPGPAAATASPWRHCSSSAVLPTPWKPPQAPRRAPPSPTRLKPSSPSVVFVAPQDQQLHRACPPPRRPLLDLLLSPPRHGATAVLLQLDAAALHRAHARAAALTSSPPASRALISSKTGRIHLPVPGSARPLLLLLAGVPRIPGVVNHRSILCFEQLNKRSSGTR